MDDQCKYNTYTCYIYNLLWFIDHLKNTLSYSINHALIKACISQCSFQFQYFTISNQFKYAHKFNSVMQFNFFFFFAIQFSFANKFCYANQFSYANQFNYANQFSYALHEFNLCLRYIGYRSHRHCPVGLQAGIRTVL